MSDRFEVHVCLVGGPATAVLLPLLDAYTRPDEVWLVAAAEQQVAAADLAAAIRTLGIAVQHVPVPDPDDPVTVRDTLEDSLSGFEHRPLVLNASGAHGVLGLNVLEWFRKRRLPVIDVRAGAEDFYRLDGDASLTEPLAGGLKLPLLFSAHGWQYRPAQHGEGRFDGAAACAARWASLLPQQEAGLLRMAEYARNADEQHSVLLRSTDGVAGNGLDELIEPLESAELLVRNHGRMSFAHAQVRRFIAGDWLLVHLLALLDGIANKIEIHDRVVMPEITRAGQGQHALGVAALIAGQLWLFDVHAPRLGSLSTELAAPIRRHRLLAEMAPRQVLLAPFGVSDLERQCCDSLNITLLDGAHGGQWRTQLERAILN